MTDELNDCQGEDEIYHMTPEEEARSERVLAVWNAWKDRTLADHKFTHVQQSHVMTMLARMQDAEHQHFGIVIPKGHFGNAENRND